jgi:hypothetical protein
MGDTCELMHDPSFVIPRLQSTTKHHPQDVSDQPKMRTSPGAPSWTSGRSQDVPEKFGLHQSRRDRTRQWAYGPLVLESFRILSEKTALAKLRTEGRLSAP